jgi:dihydrodipicolinate synthase/N-acetylneuraminate lyase
MQPKIRGVIVPILTLYHPSQGVDRRAMGALVDFLIERGVHALFPAGTTGEGPLLSLPERMRLAEIVVESACGRVPVIVHTGAINTADAITLTRHARSVGAQAAAVMPPFFYHHTDQGLIRHYETIAGQVPDFPLYLYNYPAVTNNTLSIDLVTELLRRIPSLVGMKDSGGGLGLLSACAALKNGQFNTASGSDRQILAAFQAGCDACVSGNANVVPELVVNLYHAARAGDWAKARLLQAKVDAVRQIMRDGSQLSLYKAMLTCRGLSGGGVRPPLLPADEAQTAECWQALMNLDIGISPH